MFGIFNFDVNKAQKLQNKKPWYIRYEQRRVNKKHLALVLETIRTGLLNNKSKVYLFDFTNKLFETSLICSFTAYDFIYSDIQWVKKELEKRGFIVEKYNVDYYTYYIEIPNKEDK